MISPAFNGGYKSTEMFQNVLGPIEECNPGADAFGSPARAKNGIKRGRKCNTSQTGSHNAVHGDVAERFPLDFPGGRFVKLQSADNVNDN